MVAVTGGSKDQERIVFVEAENKRSIINVRGVKRVFSRPDMKPEDCPCEIIDNVIVSK